MVMIFDCKLQRSVEKTRRCAKEEMSSSLLGKFAPPYVYVTNILLVFNRCALLMGLTSLSPYAG